jgi:hypothetical protein
LPLSTSTCSALFVSAFRVTMEIDAASLAASLGKGPAEREEAFKKLDSLAARALHGGSSSRASSVTAIHVGGLEGEELEDEAKRTLADVGVACVSPLCAMMCRDATEVALEEFQRVAGVLLALASLDPILVGAELYKLNQPAYYAIAKSAGSVFGAALAKDPQELTEAGARGPTVPTPHTPTLHTNAPNRLVASQMSPQ